MPARHGRPNARRLPSFAWRESVARLLLASCLCLAACSSAKPLPTAQRPATWATPIEGHAGLRNTWRVDEGLIRGGQPSTQGLRELDAMNTRTVINLRMFHPQDPVPEGAQFTYCSTPLHASSIDDADIAAFLKVAADPKARPVFVHCHHGSDRTGVMVAAYRVVVQGWTREEAIDEMTHGGYGFSPMWGNLIERVRKLDVEKIRREAGLPPLPAGHANP